MHVRLYEDITRHGHVATAYDYPVRRQRPLPHAALADPEVRQPQARPQPGAAAVRRRAARSASTRCRPTPRVQEPRLRGPSVHGRDAGTGRARSAARPTSFLDEIIVDDKGGRMFVCSDTDYCASAGAGRGAAPGARHERASGRCCACAGSRKRYGAQRRLPRRRLRPVAGRGARRRRRVGLGQDHACSAAWRPRWRRRRAPSSSRTRDGRRGGRAAAVGGGRAGGWPRTDWGIVHQNPRDGLRMGVTRRRQRRRAADGARRAPLRPASAQAALDWLGQRRDRRRPHRRPAGDVLGRHAAAAADRAQPRDAAAPRVHGRADRRPRRLGAGAAARPAARAGGRPRALRRSSSPTTSRWRGCSPTACWSCAAGEVVESGLTDQVLDDPQHPYTQLLVSSVLQP